MSSSRLEAEKDKVVVPMTIEEYCIKHNNNKNDDAQDFADFYDDDYDYDDDDDEEDDEDYGDVDDPIEESDEKVSELQASGSQADGTKVAKNEEDSGNEELWSYSDIVLFWFAFLSLYLFFTTDCFIVF